MTSKQDNIQKNKNAYLTFLLQNELFGINVDFVLEVLEHQKITRVPKSPDFLKGVMNYRGQILPVIDTRKKIKLKKETIEESNSVIIVMELLLKNKKKTFGAIVNNVYNVIEINPSEIMPLPEIKSNYNNDYITGVVKKDEEFIIMLDAQKVFQKNQEVFLI